MLVLKKLDSPQHTPPFGLPEWECFFFLFFFINNSLHEMKAEAPPPPPAERAARTGHVVARVDLFPAVAGRRQVANLSEPS